VAFIAEDSRLLISDQSASEENSISTIHKNANSNFSPSLHYLDEEFSGFA
jgi:hypothetical protein